MGLKIEGEPTLNRWIAAHPLAERSLEVMLELMPDMHIGWPMGAPFLGLVNLPERQAVYKPDVPDPVLVYRGATSNPTDPLFVVGSNGVVIDIGDLENQAKFVGADELRKHMQEEG